MRLVLMHLRKRQEVLERLVSALKPGGWLVVEDFDSLSLPPDPVVNPAESALATLTARLQVMTDRGLELRCGRLLDGWFRRLGLLDVGTEFQGDLMRLGREEFAFPSPIMWAAWGRRGN
jgi:hypothetical protein